MFDKGGRCRQPQTDADKDIWPKIAESPELLPISPKYKRLAIMHGPSAGESPGGVSPPGAPRTVLEPLGSHGSRCSAVDVQMSNGFALSTELLPLPVGSGPRLNNAAPSVRCHYSTLNPTTGRSAPVPRIGTLALAVFAAWASPFASERQVLTFHTRAWSGFAPPICRMPLGQASGPPPN